jgi:hypothetical protein
MNTIDTIKVNTKKVTPQIRAINVKSGEDLTQIVPLPYTTAVTEAGTMAEAYPKLDEDLPQTYDKYFMSYTILISKKLGMYRPELKAEIQYAYKRDTTSKGHVYICLCSHHKFQSFGIHVCKGCSQMAGGGISNETGKVTAKTRIGLISDLIQADLECGNALKGLNTVLSNPGYEFKEDNNCKAYVLYRDKLAYLKGLIGSKTIPPYPISLESKRLLAELHPGIRTHLSGITSLAKKMKGSTKVDSDKECLCSIDENGDMVQNEATGFKSPNISGNRFQLRCTIVHLTFSYQPNKFKIIEHFKQLIGKSNQGVALCHYSVCHELGTNSGDGKKEPYLHCHVLLQFSSSMRITHPRFFDYRESDTTTASEEHPHIKGVNPGNMEYIITTYHEKDDQEPYTNYSEKRSKVITIPIMKTARSHNDVIDIMTLHNCDALGTSKALATFDILKNLNPVKNPRHKLHSFRFWQRMMYNVLEYEIDDDRLVYWVFDTVGSIGKGSLKTHLINADMNCFSCSPNSNDAIMYNYTKYIESLPREYGELPNVDVIIIDIPRTYDANQPELYDLIERFKNTIVDSTKYTPKSMNTRTQPIVIVLSNSLPVIKKLSLDRWFIMIASVLDDYKIDCAYLGSSALRKYRTFNNLEYRVKLMRDERKIETTEMDYPVTNGIRTIMPIESLQQNYECFSLGARMKCYSEGYMPKYTITIEAPSSDIEGLTKESTFITNVERVPMTDEQKEGYQRYLTIKGIVFEVESNYTASDDKEDVDRYIEKCRIELDKEVALRIKHTTSSVETKTNPCVVETKTNPCVVETKTNPCVVETKTNPCVETKTTSSVETKTNPCVETKSNLCIVEPLLQQLPVF